MRRGELGADAFAAFHAFERRFAWHARICVIIVGVSGVYMLWRLVLWSRFESAAFWWMHAMVLIWLIFTAALFVFEPLVLRGRLQQAAMSNPRVALARLQRSHWVLLVLSIVTVLATVAGSHGWIFR